MRRALARAAVLALLLVALAACSSTGDPGRPSRSSPIPTGPTATVATGPTRATGATEPTGATASPSPIDDDVRVPRDTPTSVSDPKAIARVASGDLGALVPPGATTASRLVLTTPADPIDEIAVTWNRGNDPFAAEHGLIVWQRDGDGWRAVFAFTDAVRSGVFGLAPMQSADLTGDGVPEILTLEQQGGSGACTIARLVTSTPGDARQIYRSSGCDRQVDILRDHLEVREAVYGPNDPHCCPSSFRVTSLAWDGTALRETSTTTEPATG